MVDVVAEWTLDERAEAIEVRLVWSTEGKGDSDIEVVETIRLEGPSIIEQRRCQIQLPNQPYSFSGKLISLLWGLELVVFPTKQSTRLEITVAPGGREVALYNDDILPELL